ncbi:myosin-2 heavy chain-like isoform X1 [Anneissia japonica]|uniref:myosin-2 heavy chain-like isoform X1 n=1 Tax=Anneissia japonica TaxID=1529436 RepID=UPI001425AAEB|nr:myosin-2 heavy chain-like isoform X1 [Anneissia japonica]XP_033120445.1 myosin-2 heavy chain-like isoform X1 [Anneissia japonica]
MTAVTKAPEVASTIEHLQELGDRMRSTQYSFQDSDEEILHNISQAIKDLDNERVKVHNLLETETIAASLLRNKLQFFPEEIKKEITDAVESARFSNAEELKSLQDELKSLNDSIVFLEDKQKKLSKENAILHPERDMVRQQHEEVISQLNQRMADKASKQITLNETRDQLRDTNQKIVDLETGIIILREDMIQERADARQEKKRLKQAVHDTTKRTKKQKEANIAKKKELDHLQDELQISESQLSDIRKSIRRYETSRARLEDQENTFLEQLSNELKENKELVQKGEDLAAMQLKLTNRYESKKIEHDVNMAQLQSEIAQTKVGYDKLNEEWDDLRVDEATAGDILKREGLKVKELDDALQSKKSELMEKANQTARMKQENDMMESQMEQLDENHQITVQLLEKQIGVFRSQLAKERKERFELQEKRDALSRDMEEFRSNFNNFMSNVNQRIAKAKTDHMDLTNEGIQLRKDIKQDDIDTKGLNSELQKSDKSFGQMKSTLETTINKLECEIAELDKQLSEKIHEIKEKTPAYEELENLHDEKLKDYEDKKKNIVRSIHELNARFTYMVGL